MLEYVTSLRNLGQNILENGINVDIMDLPEDIDDHFQVMEYIKTIEDLSERYLVFVGFLSSLTRFYIDFYFVTIYFPDPNYHKNLIFFHNFVEFCNEFVEQYIPICNILVRIFEVLNVHICEQKDKFFISNVNYKLFHPIIQLFMVAILGINVEIVDVIQYFTKYYEVIFNTGCSMDFLDSVCRSIRMDDMLTKNSVVDGILEIYKDWLQKILVMDDLIPYFDDVVRCLDIIYNHKFLDSLPDILYFSRSLEKSPKKLFYVTYLLFMLSEDRKSEVNKMLRMVNEDIELVGILDEMIKFVSKYDSVYLNETIRFFSKICQEDQTPASVYISLVLGFDYVDNINDKVEDYIKGKELSQQVNHILIKYFSLIEKKSIYHSTFDDLYRSYFKATDTIHPEVIESFSLYVKASKEFKEYFHDIFKKNLENFCSFEVDNNILSSAFFSQPSLIDLTIEFILGDTNPIIFNQCILGIHPKFEKIQIVFETVYEKMKFFMNQSDKDLKNIVLYRTITLNCLKFFCKVKVSKKYDDFLSDRKEDFKIFIMNAEQQIEKSQSTIVKIYLEILRKASFVFNICLIPSTDLITYILDNDDYLNAIHLIALLSNYAKKNPEDESILNKFIVTPLIKGILKHRDKMEYHKRATNFIMRVLDNIIGKINSEMSVTEVENEVLDHISSFMHYFVSKSEFFVRKIRYVYLMYVSMLRARSMTNDFRILKTSLLIIVSKNEAYMMKRLSILIDENSSFYLENIDNRYLTYFASSCLDTLNEYEDINLVNVVITIGTFLKNIDFIDRIKRTICDHKVNLHDYIFVLSRIVCIIRHEFKDKNELLNDNNFIKFINKVLESIINNNNIDYGPLVPHLRDLFFNIVVCLSDPNVGNLCEEVLCLCFKMKEYDIGYEESDIINFIITEIEKNNNKVYNKVKNTRRYHGVE